MAKYLKKLSNYKFILLILPFWLIFNLITPPFQSPDEQSHYGYIQSLANFKYPRLPEKWEGDKVDSAEVKRLTNQLRSSEIAFNQDRVVTEYKQAMNDVSDKTYLSVQAYHPPIYYVISASFYKLSTWTQVSGIGRYYFSRTASLIFYLLLLVFVYRTLNNFFKEKTSKIFTLAIGLQPTILMLSVAINPDIAVTCLMIATLSLCISAVGNNIDLKLVLALAIPSALAILSKVNGVIVVPVIIATVIIKETWKIRKAFKEIFILLFIVLLFTLPWLVGNLLLYSKPLANNFDILYQSFPQNFSSFLLLKGVKDVSVALLQVPGVFGWVDTPIFFSFRVGYLAILGLLFCLGMIFLLLRKFDNKTSLKLSLLNFFVLLNFFFFFSYSLYFHMHFNLSAVQGRYIVSAIIPIMIISAYTLKNILKINEVLLSKIVFALSSWYFFVAVFFAILPRYYL